MQSGFNTNYRHRGVLFHVQTEDSGLANPHVITHLFHGGNIIASRKRVYSDKLQGDDLENEVRGLMETQHKEMLKQLSRGEHDEVIVQRLGPGALDGGSDNSDTIPPPTEPVLDAAPQDDSTKDRLARAFGDGIVSDKPLDEVVLDYLVENARKRKRSSR